MAEKDPEDRDAVLRFGATPDRMKVGVTRYEPARGRGRPLSLAFLREALRAAGVVAPLDEKAAARVVRRLLSGHAAGRVVIARGAPPRQPSDAILQTAAAPGLPLFPDSEFGRLTPAVQPGDGLDVAGEVVPPRFAPPPRAIVAGRGVERDATGRLTARAAGVLRIDAPSDPAAPTVVRLEPLARVSADRLSAMVDLPPRDALGRPVEPEAVLLALADEGLVFGLDAEAVTRGLAQARESGEAVGDVVVAKGTPPKFGADARLEPLRSAAAATPQPDDSSGRIDYRERGPLPAAVRGQEIARLVPAGKGVPGRDVYGRPARARDGHVLRPRVGPGVEALPPDAAGGVRYRAKRDGVLLIGADGLDVTTVLDVPGDVDFATGNLFLTEGSVRIAGTVRSGFRVEAPGAVLVDGMVENARITAGGEVRVRGGVFMSADEDAFIRAGGGFRARYAHNARVDAGGDVAVELSIVGGKSDKHSRVSADGLVRVLAPDGRIMGGSVICGRGLEVFQAGAESGVATTLAINHESPAALDLVREMRDLRTFLQRALLVLGEGDGAAALARLSPKRRAEAEELLARRDDAQNRLKDIQRRLADMARDYLERVRSARIVVYGPVHSGVAVKMGGAAFYVRRLMQRCSFSWDHDARRIVVNAL